MHTHVCVHIHTHAHTHAHAQGFPGGPVVKNLPEMQERQVWSLEKEDPLEKEWQYNSSIYYLGNPMNRGAG